MGFYGYPESNRRSLSWDLLRQLSSFNHSPWLCIEDYNDILTSDEKVGGAVRPSVFYEGFCASEFHKWRRPRFQFENSWLLEPEVLYVIMKDWSSPVQQDILLKLFACKPSL
ncbi:hypothetical protein ACFE04_029414 [Oxalis oulophora]